MHSTHSTHRLPPMHCMELPASVTSKSDKCAATVMPAVVWVNESQSKPVGQISKPGLVESAHAASTSTCSTRRRFGVRQSGTGNYVASGNQAHHRRIGRGITEFQVGLFTDLSPGREFLTHLVTDFNHPAVVFTAIVITWHNASPLEKTDIPVILNAELNFASSPCPQGAFLRSFFAKTTEFLLMFIQIRKFFSWSRSIGAGKLLAAALAGDRHLLYLALAMTKVFVIGLDQLCTLDSR